MKRNFVIISGLFLILFMSPAVFAGLYLDIEVDGNTTVKVKQDAPNTGEFAWGGFFDLEFDPGIEVLSLLDGTPVSNPGPDQIEWPWVPAPVSQSPGFIHVDKAPWVAGTPGVGTPGYEYTFAVVFAGAGNFDLTFSGVWDDEVIGETVSTPEPASMCLLGLGAILIRRRR